MNIIYQELDYVNDNEIYAAAKIHEESPLNWDPHWIRLYEKNEEQYAHIDSLWVSQNNRKEGIATSLKKRGGQKEWEQKLLRLMFFLKIKICLS